MSTGTFIVIDGADGSGKGTQTTLLVERLKKEGFDVEVTDFPRYGQRSAFMVEDHLNGLFGSADEVGPHRASIFYACDRYAASFEIKKWLQEGKIVVSNRYVSSNMGHQAGKIKDPEKRDEFLGWLEHLEYDIFEIPKPDVNVLLHVPPEIGHQLIGKKEKRDYIKEGKRDIHEADLNHLKNASEAYSYVAQKYGWHIIDCAPQSSLKSIEEIHELLWDKILPFCRKAAE